MEVKKGGVIRGLVKFPEESPPRAMFANQGDPKCPRGIPQDHLIVKQENRGIQNAVVVLVIQRGKPLPVINTTEGHVSACWLPETHVR